MINIVRGLALMIGAGMSGLLCSSCSDNESSVLSPKIDLYEATSITGTSAVLGAAVTPQGGNVKSSVFSVSPYENFVTGTKEVAMAPATGIGLAMVKDLDPFTKYYYRIKVSSGYSDVTSDTKQFTTLYMEKPSIESLDLVSQTGNKIKLKIGVKRGDYDINDLGIVYKSQYDADSIVKRVALKDTDSYEVEIKDLYPDTKYDNIRAYLTSQANRSVSKPLSLTTDHTVYLDSAGTLGRVVPEDLRINMKELKIVGPFNGADLIVINEMAGFDNHRIKTPGELYRLDLGDATLTASDDLIFDGVKKWSTRNNIIDPCFVGNFRTLHDLVIPANTTSIEGGGLQSYISYVEIPERNEKFKSVDGVMYTKDMKKLVGFPSFKSADTYTLPEGVEELGRYSMCGVKRINNLVLPKTLKSIGQLVFYYYQSSGNTTTDLVIPETVTSMDYQAFMGAVVKRLIINAHIIELPFGAVCDCVHVESLTLSGTIKTFEPMATYNMPALKELHVQSSTPPTLNNSGYEAYPNLGNIDKENCVLYVPKGASSTYKSTNVWKDFTHIVEE